jgi:bacillolysin
MHTGKDFGFKTLQTSVDKKNISHIHFQETWNGIPVANTMWIAHVKDGKVISCNGWIVADIDASSSVSINEATALSWAMTDINAKTYRWQSPVYNQMNESQHQQAMNVLYPKGELYFASINGDNKNFKLCYRFDVHAIVPLSRNYVFVDASTGVIVNKISRIHEADAVGSAITGYVGTQTIITDSFAGGFRLREASRGDGVETYNMETGLDYANAVDFTDADNMWNNVNANLDQYATDAHYGAEMTYDYYWFNHSRNSVDDNGMKLLSYVHYDVGYYNAFWDGQEMTYGDGTGGPLTALDVCGHEISHGVTELSLIHI